MDIWDDFDEIHTSENVRPYVYDETQLYCIIGLEHGGVTLENIVLGSWSQAAEIFQQVADTLAKGEAKFEFEVEFIPMSPLSDTKSGLSTVICTVETWSLVLTKFLTQIAREMLQQRIATSP